LKYPRRYHQTKVIWAITNTPALMSYSTCHIWADVLQKHRRKKNGKALEWGWWWNEENHTYEVWDKNQMLFDVTDELFIGSSDPGQVMADIVVKHFQNPHWKPNPKTYIDEGHYSPNPQNNPGVGEDDDG